MAWRLDGTSPSRVERPHSSARTLLSQDSHLALQRKYLFFDSALMMSVTDSTPGLLLFLPPSPSFALLLIHFAEIALKVKISSLRRSPEADPRLSMASNLSSSSGLSVEARIQELESAMGRIRGRMAGFEKKLEDSTKAGDKTWDLLNADIRKLRDDHAASAEKMKDFKAEVRTGFKDEANVHGDFGKRLNALEKAVAKLELK